MAWSRANVGQACELDAVICYQALQKRVRAQFCSLKAPCAVL